MHAPSLLLSLSFTFRGLLTSGVNAGSLLNIGSGSYDLLMHESCCIHNTNCDGYRERRPTNNGSGYEPPPLGKAVTLKQHR